VKRISGQSSLRVTQKLGVQAVPQPEEIAFRTRNMSARSRSMARALGWTLAKLEKAPGLQSGRGRFQFWTLTRA
jgi:hypothetical protein